MTTASFHLGLLILMYIYVDFVLSPWSVRASANLNHMLCDIRFGPCPNLIINFVDIMTGVCEIIFDLVSSG